ncbi:hypothetical protein B0J18DRAFT_492754 [Chaetomium sp. MPI-SDFR-AT-0129]|nr:hypothetical protein B0J18DRAFT_492754 [Chaetomium sp. MPI-SDFR-AT-0129]
MRTHHLTSWLLLAGPALTTAGCGPTHLLPTRQIYQFSKPTYLQAFHVRANGDMLLGTVFPNASLYYLTAPPINDNGTDNHPKVTTLATFAGIPSPDGTTINAIHRHRRDRTGCLCLYRRGAAEFGIAADTSLGQILRVDTRARTWEVILSDADTGHGSMHYPPWASLQFGVNGLAVRDIARDQGGELWLYWSNSFLATVYRVRITADGYPVGGGSGKTRRAEKGKRKREVLWAATNVDNTVRAISDRGEVTTVAGAPDEMTVAGAVAPRFGRRLGDEHMLYVATSGGLVLPVNGTELEGGKVVGIDTRGLFECWEE